jgi:recombination protein RecT
MTTPRKRVRKTPAQQELQPAKEISTPVESLPAEVNKPLTPIQRFQKYMESYKENVLPDLLATHHIPVSKFVQVVLTEIKKNDKLQQAFIENPASMFASILAGAEIGLMPSNQQEFFLIPRRIDGKMTVTPQIGYRGLVSIILRSGEVDHIDTYVVFEGEEFKVTYGLTPNIIHVADYSVKRDSETFKFVYAVATLKSGRQQFFVLSKGEIVKIQQLSKYNNELYFNDRKDPNFWMARKTALIQLAKLLPKDYYGKQAVDLETRIEGGAYLSLDEDNQIKIVEAKQISTVKQPSAIKTFNSLPDLPE